ncbi:hypothetical protein L226DRAFT_614935 [Lentinus tigrinus ALCF2SS1-7]|uniref:F-box domain-containing protein n=1 Tax=Lentinus tigrinus ALCF2SS1-6 TaxID=1328759 RepID=A0A5C2S3N5_9APHY|nr:hypothetical protein L227DRAFT_655093 [Lentinus tigrinus ALCF2SS1-6]RPD72203.1 hypothetical protein L226DRAFT_614935 [Lentinus tigrinus ALCF2SS1-7]
MAHIMARSTPSTISALMKTCHLYYHEGPRHLLRDGVNLRSPMQVERFLPFISAEGGARFVHFRELDIAVDMYRVPRVVVERCMEQLAQLLSSTEARLESLTLREAEWLLQYGCVASALRTSKIQRLIIGGSGPRACSALKFLSYSLVSLTVSFKSSAIWSHVEGLQTMDGWSYLLDSLSPHVQTLEIFRCDSLPPATPSHQPNPSSSSRQITRHNLCFSTVRTLGLFCSLLPRGQIDVASLFPTFPNVTRLEIMSMPLQNPAESLQSLRESNTAIFKRGGCWAALENCSGELASLYTLGLVCHVVDLCIWSQVEDDDDLSMLAAVVSATRPKVLRLSVDGPFTLLTEVTKALRDAGFKSLETLHLILNIRELYRLGDGAPVDLTEHIFAVLTPLPPQLITLELLIEFRGPYIHTPKPDVQALEELRRKLIAYSKPTLQSVSVLHAHGYRLRPPSGLGPENDDSDSDVDYDGEYDGMYDYISDDSWAYDSNEDGFDSDYERRCAHDDW